jgi:hypothetical protein
MRGGEKMTEFSDQLNTIESTIALEEGKKHNAPVGDVREIVKIAFGVVAGMEERERKTFLSHYV